jgi:ssDNA-binding Zn-finger/Zn-ribbon topoisomerase 1
MPTSGYEPKFSEQKRKRNGVFLYCETCKKEFYVYPSRLKQAESNGCVTRYCSMKCYVKRGEANPFWGKRHSSDSVKKMVAHPNRPRFAPGELNPNFVRFGKDFTPISASSKFSQRERSKAGACERCGFDEVEILQLHHKDRNRRNNKAENLETLCPNCHFREHFQAQDGMYSRFAQTR